MILLLKYALIMVVPFPFRKKIQTQNAGKNIKIFSVVHYYIILHLFIIYIYIYIYSNICGKIDL